MMMIGRRTFIVGTALVATTPAIVNLLSLSSPAQSRALPLPGPLPPQLAVGGTDMNRVVCKIDGWDRCDGVVIDTSTIASADPVTNDPAGDQDQSVMADRLAMT
jgi:hypothetical protein